MTRWPVVATDGCMDQEQQGPESVWTATSIDAIERGGWNVLQIEDFKPGVRRAHCTKGREFRMVYVRGAI